MKYDIKKQLRSFKYAWCGFRKCALSEQNLCFHLAVTVLVIAAGFAFGITRTEWLFIILCIGMVIAAELINTAIEKVVDLASPERHPLAGQAKDIAAAAVLVCAIMAIIIGLIIFVPYII
ncbi:MAG: diacylglycerol kinase family protein, partial [Mediterranea sp.]|nr:diacylglycerol kinase family protein [Mediterranea sp.]